MEIVGCSFAFVALVTAMLHHLREIRTPDANEGQVAEFEKAFAAHRKSVEVVLGEFTRELGTLKTGIALKQSFGK